MFIPFVDLALGSTAIYTAMLDLRKLDVFDRLCKLRLKHNWKGGWEVKLHQEMKKILALNAGDVTPPYPTG